MAPTKLACKNNEKFTYSGKEMSPLGLGYCADAEMVGSFMTGKDSKTWIVGVKNNEKVWIRYAEKKVLEPEAQVILAPEAEPEATLIDLPEAAPETQLIAPEEEAEPAKAEPKANLINSPEAGAEAEPEAEEEKPKPKRKYTKKAKAESEGEEAEKPKPKKEKAKKQAEIEPKPQTDAEKPKRKYTKKAKQPETETAVDSEAKPKTKRGPSGYNLYIGMKINEFRQNETGLKTTEYMKKAQEAWGALSKEEQKEISAELKAAAAAKEA